MYDINVLFLSLYPIWDIYEREIYPDLLREFLKNGHRVYVISPIERRYKQKTQINKQGNATILKLHTLNIQKTNFLEKGIGTVLIEYQFLFAIKKFFLNIQFDMVLYATPPITLVQPIVYVKKKYNAIAYLMLKDIFPQNAVDLEMMHTNGVSGLVYRFFRRKEKKMYSVSDVIGCMSQANVDYIINHNHEINPKIVELCPNAIDIQDYRLENNKRIEIRKKYKIPADKHVFVYGGNLGKPQCVQFLIDCLRAEKNNVNVYFLIVGDGTEYDCLHKFINNEKPLNVKLIKSLPRSEFERMVSACDVGLIFLDHRFTIPNFPSRLLSYMQAGIPVLACTDTSSDVGNIIVENRFGWWCESNNVQNFIYCIDKIINEVELKDYGIRSFDTLNRNYDVKNVYKSIVKWLETDL